MKRLERFVRMQFGVASRRAIPRVAGVVVALLVAVTCTTGAAVGLPGEDPLEIKDAIGRGVHAFNTGDFDRAYDELTRSIDAGSEDPRAYYFRGLASLRLGRSGEAEADFAAGAEREAEDGSTRRVSRSLERVQGCDRLTLERYRKRARLAGLQRDHEAAARRYSTIEDPSGEILRRRRPEDIAPELVAPRRGDGVEEVPAPRPAAGSRAKPGEPFADEPEAMEGDDPFGDRPKKSMEGDEEPTEPGDRDAEMAEEPEEDAFTENLQAEPEQATNQ